MLRWMCPKLTITVAKYLLNYSIVYSELWTCIYPLGNNFPSQKLRHLTNASLINSFQNLPQPSTIAKAFAEGNLYFLWCMLANYCWGKIILAKFILIFGKILVKGKKIFIFIPFLKRLSSLNTYYGALYT